MKIASIELRFFRSYACLFAYDSYRPCKQLKQTMKPSFQSIRFILGDQLTPGLSSLSDAKPDRDLIVMAEPRDEATYVSHHRQKIVMILSAMRHFAAELRDQRLLC